MVLQQINELEARCQRCGHVLFLGQTEDGLAPVCAPSVQVGLVCRHCAAVEPSLDEVSFLA